ncbi:MAG: NUDIX domain-containing protein [Bacteroidota bacterium]|nr:NUDIX domain-containing protein [uncultured Allomuricauda sp.]
MKKHFKAAYLILKQKNKILLLRRFNTGYEDGNYSFIAGKVEPDENFTQCVIREAEEEAGVIVRGSDVNVVHVMHRNNPETQWVDVFFQSTKWSGEITNREPHKCDDLSWFDLDALPNNTVEYVKQAIEAIKNDCFYSEHGWGITVKKQ